MTARTATVGVATGYTRHFARDRPLKPRRGLPRAWREANREAARRFLRDARDAAGL